MSKIDTARRLRRDMTPSERYLWEALRNRRTGFKFRRQMPLGPYFADYACQEAALVVEIDGEHHNGNAHDERRDAWMAARGWTVVRYSNPEVLWNLDAVVTDIRRRLADYPKGAAPFPHPACRP